MKFRRCHALLIEPRETKEIDLAALVAGQPRLSPRRRWLALAAHLDAEIELDPEALALLGALSPDEWTSHDALLDLGHPADTIESLRRSGLLLADEEDGAAAKGDQQVRAGHWRSLSAVAHRHLRWRGIDTRAARADLGEDPDGSRTARRAAQLGPPPPPALARTTDHPKLPLPAPSAGALDALLQRRITCRNFDPARPVSMADLASVLSRVYGARARTEVTGVPVLKKNVPSAGGLHPVEAYLLVRRVEGLAPGLYHYHCVDHALEPMTMLEPAQADDLARRFVAHQAWFVDAPVQVVLAARFRRTFWKYRNHAKAWRAVVLDAGHLSQLQYLVATELGLAAFITAAVNEGDIEDAFGLDPMVEGVLAVTGFGHRGAAMAELEFDPLHAVWPPAPG
jgi:putative peptide maturation dehydrogenase